ncbi:MAG: hypothetical protein GX580_08375 [Candidatus Hydrogenedens sp.]|nr:hypothetical protein [Candidatus Hydrogenedens sp.]
MAYSDEQYRVPPPGVAADPVRTPAELDRMAARARGVEKARRRKEAARARWALLNRFCDDGMAGLKPADAAVWLALFRHARADGVATVARARLEVMTGRERKTITAALSRLAAAGWVERLRRGGPSGGMAVYRVTAPEKVG